MVRKITPSFGGWRKRSGIPDNHRAFERAAPRALVSLPTSNPVWRDTTIRSLVEPLRHRRLAPAMFDAINTLATNLVELEFPRIAESSLSPRSPIDAVAHRKRMQALLDFQANADHQISEWLAAVAAILALIADAGRASAGHPSTSIFLSTPLIDVVSAPAELIAKIVDRILHFATDDPFAVRPGAVAARRVKEALLRVSKLTEDAARRNPHRLIAPAQSGLVGVDLATAYLSGTPFLELLKTPVAFELTQRFSHQHIVATPGAGKTNLLSTMIWNDLDRVAAGKASVIVLDSQGDLIHSIVRHIDFAPGGRLHDRLVYIDSTDIEYPLNLSIFARRGQARTALEKRSEYAALLDMLLFLFGALKQEATGRQETLLRAVAALIQEIPDATLLTLNEIFEPFDRKKQPLAQFAAYLAKLDPSIQRFFAVDFNNASTFGQSREQIRARVQALITDDIFRNMFSSPRQKLDFAAEMNAGKVILINAYKDLLQSGTEIFGRFFLALVAQAAQARSNIADENQRLATYCYVDECHDYIKSDVNVEKILDSARKYRVGIILAHQRLSQLSDALRSAASMAAIKMVRAPVLEDRTTLASQLHATPDYLDALAPRVFATHIAGMSAPIALRIPLSPLANAQHMSEAQFAQVREVMRRKYAQPLTSNPANHVSVSRPVGAQPSRASQPSAVPSAAPWTSDEPESE